MKKFTISDWVIILSLTTALVFLVLKVSGFINWSWFWTLSPLVFGASLLVILTIVWIILALIVAYLENKG